LERHNSLKLIHKACFGTDSRRHAADRVNILLVDDQQAKLLSYEVILAGIGETLIKASSACETFECLLKNDIGRVFFSYARSTGFPTPAAHGCMSTFAATLLG
jgi:hypothetical protein